MATEVIMPSLGFDMVEGTVARWLKKEGDPVEKGEPIVEIETEKATVEVEAAASGNLTEILVPAGETVKVGTVIGTIAAPEEKPKRREPRPPPSAPAAEEAKKAPLKVRQPPEERREEPGKAEPPGHRIRISPVARRMAEEAGIDLSRLEGSGPDGRILERDVREAMGEKTPSAVPEAKTGPSAGEPAPMSRMRKAIARRMAESKAKAPHFYLTADIHMEEAMKMREQLNLRSTT